MEFYLGMYIIVIARILLAVIFLLNGSGIISQTIAARELAERHVSDRLIPFFMFAARTLEIVAGLALAAGIFPQYAALVLFSFIFPATFVAHTFWSAKNAEDYQRQLKNFSINVAIWGALLFIAGTPFQPAVLHGSW